MYTSDIHKEYMSYALELAKKGRGKVSPNPLVGCVIVKNGKIIGEGFHEKFGSNHAEVNAFNNCSESPIDADLYVNLEPCSFYGKTPPCVDAIISNSIKNVFIGNLDPNDEVNGKGIKKLQNARINVYKDILSDECFELNIGFYHWIKTGKPWVIAKVAQSKDGFLGISPNKTTSITGDDSKYEVHKLRSKVDAILVGRRTAEIDNPQLTVRKVLGPNPIRVIADTYRKLPLTLNLFNDNASKNIVLCSQDVFDNSKTSFCEYLSVKLDGPRGNVRGHKFMDPHNILEVLGKSGITTLIIEGGMKLLNSFIRYDLIDEMHIYTSNDIIKSSKLKNPLKINDDWNITKEKDFENDSLIVARRKELCLQE
tara:strand:- start:2 stop:1105 length:1104 start_codon:yes stop_codon:yes gene_type:complete